MDKKRQEWAEHQVWLKLAATLARNRDVVDRTSRRDFDRSSLKWTRRTTAEIIKTFRSENRSVVPYQPIQDTKFRIISRVSEQLREIRPGTACEVSVGSNAKGVKSPKHVAVTVRYTWLRNVRPLYDMGLSSDWFVLHAEEFRINQNYTRLWVCDGFNLNTGETKKVYVTHASFKDKSKISLAHSAANANAAAYDFIQKQLTKALTGAENGEDNA